MRKPPEALKRKWEQEEMAGPQMVICPSCKKETPAENLNCVFCGTDLDFKNEGDQRRPNCHNKKEIKSLGGALTAPQFCPVNCFLKWVKRLFKRAD